METVISSSPAVKPGIQSSDSIKKEDSALNHLAADLGSNNPEVRDNAFRRLLEAYSGSEHGQEFIKLISIRIEQAQQLKKQGNAEAGQQLLYQLMETLLEFYYMNKVPDGSKRSEIISQLLNIKLDQDDPCRKETVHRMFASGWTENCVFNFMDDLKTLREYVLTSNVPQRPMANFQLGELCYQRFKTSNDPSFLPWAITHFQTASKNQLVGEMAKAELRKINAFIKHKFNRAISLEKKMDSGKFNSTTRQIILELYKSVYEVTQSPAARFMYLRLLRPEKITLNESVELGILYLKAEGFLGENLFEIGSTEDIYVSCCLSPEKIDPNFGQGKYKPWRLSRVLEGQKLLRDAAGGHEKAKSMISNGKIWVKTLSVDTAEVYMILANEAMRKHEQRGLLEYWNTEYLSEATTRYKLAMEFYAQDTSGKELVNMLQETRYTQAEKKYLHCKLEAGDPAAQLEFGKRGLNVPAYQLPEYLAQLEKAGKNPDKKIAGQAHYLLAQLYLVHFHHGFNTDPVSAQKAIPHFQSAIEFGNQDAPKKAFDFLKPFIPTSLDEGSPVIQCLKAIVTGADKEVARDAAFALYTHYENCKAGLFDSVSPLKESKKYQLIGNRLNNEIIIAENKKTSSDNSPLKAATTKQKLLEVTCELALMYRNGTGGERNDLKAVELLIQEDDAAEGSSEFRKLLIEMAGDTISPEAQYKLSQVIAIVCMKQYGKDDVSGEKLASELLVKAAKGGYQQAVWELQNKEKLKQEVQKTVTNAEGKTQQPAPENKTFKLNPIDFNDTKTANFGDDDSDSGEDNL